MDLTLYVASEVGSNGGYVLSDGTLSIPKGREYIGYLGNGTMGIASEPTVVSGGLSFTSLAAGDGYHCGTIAGGATCCWGANKNGRLGNGTTADALVPTAVSGGHAFTQLSGGQDHTCGVRTDGNAYCWGGNDKGELGNRTQTATLTPVRVRLFFP